MDNRDSLIERMRHLPPLRNINAIHAWLSEKRPQWVAAFERFHSDAVANHPTARVVLMLMMFAFAAGRVYQEANPDAPKDPDGYGG